jgi:hypothetical protein
MGESMTVSCLRKIDGRMLGRQMYVSLKIFLPRMVNRPVGIESNARLAPVRSSRSLCGVIS